MIKVGDLVVMHPVLCYSRDFEKYKNDIGILLPKDDYYEYPVYWQKAMIIHYFYLDNLMRLENEESRNT